jgi:hypothetical protein
MAQAPSPIKLFQIEEPDGSRPAEDGFGMAVGIELSRARGVAVAASVGGNAELILRLDGGNAGVTTEAALADLLREARATTEKAAARPVTHAIIRLDGIDVADGVVLRAAASADLALLGVRRDGTVLEAAVEAEDIAGALSR